MAGAGTPAGQWWEKGDYNFLGSIARALNNFFVDPGRALTEGVTDLTGSDFYKTLTEQKTQQLNPYADAWRTKLSGLFDQYGLGAQNAMNGMGALNTDYSKALGYGQRGLADMRSMLGGMDLTGAQNAGQRSVQAAEQYDPTAYVKQFLSLQPQFQGLLDTDTSRQWAASDAASQRGASQAMSAMSKMGGLNSGASQLAAQRAAQEISYNTASDIANRNAALQQQLYGNAMSGLASQNLGRLSAQQQGFGQLADAISAANQTRLGAGQGLANAGLNLGQLATTQQSAANEALLSKLQSMLGYYGGLQGSALGGLNSMNEPIYSSQGSLLNNLTGAAGGAGSIISVLLKLFGG